MAQGLTGARAARIRVDLLAIAAIVALVVLDLVFAWRPLHDIYHRASSLAWSWGAIGAFSVTAFGVTLLRSRLGHMLGITHWLFVHFFFFFAPIAQFESGKFPWDRMRVTDTHLLLTANMAILTWCGVWAVGYALTQLLPRYAPQPMPVVRIKAMWVFTGVLAVVVPLFVAWRIKAVGVTGLFLRGQSSAASASPMGSILGTTVRGLVILHVALALLRAKEVGWWKSKFLLLISLVALLATCFPTSLARFILATIGIGIFLTVFRGRRTSAIYSLLVILGIMVLAPFLSAARYARNWAGLVKGVREASRLQHLTGADFDAYAMLAYTIDYVSKVGTTHGHQLLSTLLFFVPRSRWPGKGLGSGYTVAQFEKFPVFNVSSPAPAEGLINFGWAGLIAFALVLAVLFSRFDTVASSWKFRTLSVVYPFVVGFSLFLLRGDLMSSLSFGLGLLSPVAIGGWALTRRSIASPDSLEQAPPGDSEGVPASGLHAIAASSQSDAAESTSLDSEDVADNPGDHVAAGDESVRDSQQRLVQPDVMLGHRGTLTVEPHGERGGTA